MYVARSAKRQLIVGVHLLIVAAAGCNRGVLAGGGGGGGDGPPDAGPDVSASIYYVSVAGDDEADGQSADTAFRTVARAVEAVGPGDTVAIMPGTYAEALTLDGLGSPEATITIRGEVGHGVR